MGRSTNQRALAVVTAAALLASLTAATVASPVSAAKPKCQGKVATIVGTAKSETIRGTAGRDVIVAKGGADRIYAKGGNDVICAGGGNDTLNGGTGVDKCYQGTGTGPVNNCELPAPPAPPAPTPAPTPPPPPPPPTLVRAYADVNANHTYDAGDVMIAEIVDTNGSGTINPGDTINMGQYPTSPNIIKPAQLRSDFEPWKVKTHTVNSTDTQSDPHFVLVTTTVAGQLFAWRKIEPGESTSDQFVELAGSQVSAVADFTVASDTEYDRVQYKLGSPSQPTNEFRLALDGEGAGDDGFIDVDILAP